MKGSSDSSRSEDAVLMVDEEADEVLFYDSGGDVSTVSFAQILNALQTANNESLGGMERICAVIKSLVSPVCDENEGKSRLMPSMY